MEPWKDTPRANLRVSRAKGPPQQDVTPTSYLSARSIRPSPSEYSGTTLAGEGDDRTVISERTRDSFIDPAMADEVSQYTLSLGFDVGDHSLSLSEVDVANSRERTDLAPNLPYLSPHAPGPTPTSYLTDPPRGTTLVLPLQIRHSPEFRSRSPTPTNDSDFQFAFPSKLSPRPSDMESVLQATSARSTIPPSIPPPHLSLPPRARSKERPISPPSTTHQKLAPLDSFPTPPPNPSSHVPSQPPKLPALNRVSGFSHLHFRPTSTGSYSVPNAAARDLLSHPLMTGKREEWTGTVDEDETLEVDPLLTEADSGVGESFEGAVPGLRHEEYLPGRSSLVLSAVWEAPPSERSSLLPFSPSDSVPPSPHRSEFSSTAHQIPPGSQFNRQSNRETLEIKRRNSPFADPDRAGEDDRLSKNSSVGKEDTRERLQEAGPSLGSYYGSTTHSHDYSPASPISPYSPRSPSSSRSPHSPHYPPSPHSHRFPNHPAPSIPRRPYVTSIAGSAKAFAPTPPPQSPIPQPPPFVSIFVDPATNIVPAPSVSKLRNHVVHQTSDQVSLEQSRLSSWMARNENGEGSASLDRTSASGREHKTESDEKLVKGNDGARDSTRRFSEKSSMWSYSVFSKREKWNSLGEGGSGSRRSKREDREREQELKRVLRGRRNTQHWLSGVSAEPPPEAPDELVRKRSLWSIFGKAHRRSPSGHLTPSARRLRISFVIAVLLLLAIIAAVVGIEVSHHSSTSPSTIGSCSCENGGAASVKNGKCACSCVGAFGGPYCQSSTTCVTPPGGGNPIAQGLVDIATEANTIVSPNINLTRLAFVLENYLGLPSSSTSCASQLQLVSLPNLPPSAYPRRMGFASTSILWAAAISETSPTKMQSFVNSLDFSALGDIVTTPNSNYQILFAGYIFDYSAMAISLPTANWTKLSSPTAAQAQLVDTNSLQTLTRMSAFAISASTQRSTALAHLWQELNLSTVDLSLFRSAIRAAPVMIPFDSTATVGGTNIFTLANQQTTSTSFPPAIGCLPGLFDSQVVDVNTVEVSAFALAPVSASDGFDSSCLDRPLYGILNILNLALPFLDMDRPNLPLPRQGLVLSGDNKARMTLHAGALLLGEQQSPPMTPSSPSTPDQFGTFAYLDHVILEFLQLLSPSVAQALVAYVISSPNIPPSSSSTLSQLSSQLSSLPVIEVELWGGLRYSNVDHSVSSLANGAQNSSLFFGSTLGSTFRTWAHSGPQKSASQSAIRWTASATSQTVVSDAALSNASFLQIWNAANSSAGVQGIWDQLVAAGLAA